MSSLAAIDARDEAADARSDRDAIELLQIRSDLRRAMIAEVNTTMLSVFGEASGTAVVQRRTDRVEVVRASRARVDELAGANRPIAAEALVLGDGLGRDGLTEDEADPGMLFEGSWFVTVAGEPPDERTPSDQLALADLASLDSIGALVLNDALDAATVMTSPTVPELLTDYAERAEPYIRSDGGYLGPDRSQPLAGASVFRDRAPDPHPAHDDVVARLVESRLWEYDRWIQSWQDVDPDEQPGPPPLTLAELVDETQTVDAEVRDIVDSELASAHASADGSATSSQRTSNVLIVLASLLAIAGIAPLVVALARRLRTFRRHADQIARDPLTGAGNRLQLDHVAALMHRSGADQHHVVIAVDLDRFKLVNDSLGHAAGDRVLVTVAQRLTDLVERWSRRSPAGSGTVIRMGGDEFLCALHTSAPIDEAQLRRELDAIRDDTIGVDHHAVPLRFSLGLAFGTGACDLNQLVSVADLAAYEDKAVRARALASIELPAPAAARR